jgi:glycerol-3-phosphate acyltransferase PlsY
METNLGDFLTIISFYLIGSVPFAILTYKFMSTEDPRKLGSTNPGATNMYRIAGPLPGILTFLGDFLKGFIPIYLLAEQNITISYIYSFFILFGHMFPIFNKFKGGKGVATSFGFILALDYLTGLSILLVWLAVFLFKKISGLSAVISFIFLPIFIFVFINSIILFLIALFHSLIILFNHRTNIRELMKDSV